MAKDIFERAFGAQNVFPERKLHTTSNQVINLAGVLDPSEFPRTDTIDLLHEVTDHGHEDRDSMIRFALLHGLIGTQDGAHHDT